MTETRDSGKISANLLNSDFFRRNRNAIILAIVFFIGLWFTRLTPVGILWAVYWPGIFVLQLVIITTPWRIVSLRQVMLMFLLGMSIVLLLTFIVQFIMFALVNLDVIRNTLYSVIGSYDLMASVVAPVTEEIFKIAPLVMLLWGGWRGFKYISGPLDTAVLAGACGAGFDFFENLLRVANNNWLELGPDRGVPVASPQLGPFYIFPDMHGSTAFGNPMVWFGHGEITAFIGLAIGLGWYLRKKSRFWWLIPGAALIWATWDHFLVNYYATPHAYRGWTNILPGLELYGWLLPIVFLLGFFYAIYLSNKTQQWYLTVDRKATLDKSLPALLLSFTARPQSLLNRCASLLRFWRLRIAVANGMRNFSQTSRNKPVKYAALLATLREQMMAERARLIGDRAV